MRARRRRVVAILAAVLLATGVTVVGQSALAQFKVTEVQARDVILSELNGGVGQHGNREAVSIARQAFEAMPASARAGATTALYAWTKTYVRSAAFKSAYAAYRKEMTPVENVHKGTVDEAVKKIVDEEKAELEKQIKELTAAGMKDVADALRQQAKMFSEPAYVDGKRREVEEKRAYDKQNYDTALAIVNERLLPNAEDAVAAHLRAFLDATPDVDFAAKQRAAVGGDGGTVLVFVNDAYNQKPWQWQLSYEFGPEATAAARAAAAAWLKELGK